MIWNINKLYSTNYYKELIDLNFIKYSINQGDLTKSSFVTKGVNSCYYHGEDKLRDESLNLVADTAEEIVTGQNTKQTKQVAKAIKTARALDIISPFNLANFGVSVACKFNNDKIKKAIEKISECNLYLSNIQGHYAQTGYVYTLGNCLDVARANFKDYHDDGFSKN